MTINITFDSEFWTAISAIGTVGAALTALWIAYMPRVKRVSLALVWGGANDYCPFLVIKNLSDRIIVPNEIHFYFSRKDIGILPVLKDPSLKTYMFLSPHETYVIPIKVNYEHERDRQAYVSGLYLPTVLNEKDTHKRILKIVLNDIDHKSYCSKQFFSKYDMSELHIGYEMLSK